MSNNANTFSTPKIDLPEIEQITARDAGHEMRKDLHSIYHQDNPTAKFSIGRAIRMAINDSLKVRGLGSEPQTTAG